MESEKTDTTALVRMARDITISTTTQFDEAKRFLLDVITAKKKIQEWWDPVVSKAHDAWKEAVKHRKIAMRPVEEAEAFIRPKMANYIESQRTQAKEQNEILAAKAAESNLPVLEVPTFKDDNVTTKINTKYEVFDRRALIAAVMSGVVPEEAVIPNDEFLRKMVSAMGIKLSYPGVRVYTQPTLVVKSKED